MLDIFSTPSVLIGSAGFATALAGTLTGVILSFVLTGKDNRFKEILLRLLGGFMLSLVLFDFLPESYENGNFALLLSGIIAGLLLAWVFDKSLGHDDIDISKAGEHRFLKAAVIMSIGIGMHNLPSGIALGSLLYISLTEGVHLIMVLVLHGIPEGITLGEFFKECKFKKLVIFATTLLISLPMGIGSLAGAVISSVSPFILSISLSFTAGLILYILFVEIFPKTREAYSMKAWAVEMAFGFCAGLLFSLLMH